MFLLPALSYSQCGYGVYLFVFTASNLPPIHSLYMLMVHHCRHNLHKTSSTHRQQSSWSELALLDISMVFAGKWHQVDGLVQERHHYSASFFHKPIEVSMEKWLKISYQWLSWSSNEGKYVTPSIKRQMQMLLHWKLTICIYELIPESSWVMWIWLMQLLQPL